MDSKKDILLIAATHGNEQFSIPIMRKLEKQYPGRFDWLIGNERALKQNRRFVDTDLNRAAPGKRKGALYEQRRAWELMNIVRKYRYVIDVHGTPARTGLFTIVCNPTPENILLAAVLPVERVVIWSDDECRNNGPLSQFVSCGVEIECGPKESLEIQNQLFCTLQTFLRSPITVNPAVVQQKEFFRICGRLKERDTPIKIKKSLKESKKMKIRKEVFYPLLIGRYQDVLCYKMEKINWWDQFSF